ncbi:MAG: hypothetical protein CTY12_01990 [Methylotenera sp.]|nr:MAG: hypothetical protein CTY12_01990 [Methylotenera sp.]
MKFYKNLSPKAQAVFLICVGIALMLVGLFGGGYVKQLAKEADVEARFAIKPEYLTMGERELRGHFVKNKAELALVAGKCADEKKALNEIPVNVAEVCKLAQTMNFFKVHKERPSTFSSGGGTR